MLRQRLPGPFFFRQAVRLRRRCWAGLSGATDSQERFQSVTMQLF